MSQRKTEFDALPLDLTVITAFQHIMKNVIDVVTTQEKYVETRTELLGLDFQAKDEGRLPNYLEQVTKLLRRLVVLNNGKAYDSELIVAQCQSKICESGICKQKLRKSNKDWTKEDLNADADTRIEHFKNFYITETAILAADEVQGTTNRVNSAMEQKLTNLQATVAKLHHDNSVLMAN